jgi:hypothetical protein
VSAICPSCEEPIGETVTLVSECYQRVTIEDGDIGRPEVETSLRVLCDHCMSELPDDVAIEAGVAEDLIPWRPGPIPPKPMYVLTREWVTGEHDWTTRRYEVVAVAETPGPLIRTIFEQTVTVAANGFYEVKGGANYRIAGPKANISRTGEH